MKNAKLLLLAVGILSLAFVGCEIVTEDQPALQIKPANGIVINELFILPPPNPNSYYWLELFNPTSRSIDITKWTLGYKTARATLAVNTLNPRGEFFIKGVFGVDSVLTYRDVRMFPIFQVDTLFLRLRPSPTPPDTIRRSSRMIIEPRSMAASSFITFLSNEARMHNYTAWGPGGGEKIIPSTILGSTFLEFQRDFYEARMQPDSTGRDTLVRVDHLDSVIVTTSTFFFQNADQIVLKDSSGQVVDLIRYGGSAFQYPTPDNYSANRTLGPIVPYQSFARYAGAYKTGAYSNSAEDFYVTGVQIPLTRPIPHWLSQAYKQ